MLESVDRNSDDRGFTELLYHKLLERNRCVTFQIHSYFRDNDNRDDIIVPVNHKHCESTERVLKHVKKSECEQEYRHRLLQSVKMILTTHHGT
jgi:hypothetical protein